ncbi:hypothetical protein J2T02_005504 [Chitinophaga terrae (ex Kim and Jung 2007)]|uniref:hypothetical protein n=1 Tax=Chitinophaga terrae (ex Kim and Jung 2007) TaxID=408074 RepID=UPI00277D3ED3|nr:hypothetical protein [Chitinophaga terrae (ex Kim and Jung 2007)]MDQ0110354.1 hypothetical protein [Chitinophaga terrae (ex Kim and Jung 2007)]
MRILFLIGMLFPLILFSNSCQLKKVNNDNKATENVTGGELKSTGKFILNNNLDSIIHSFINVNKTNCKDCIYEIYFDKQDDYDQKITLRCISSYENYIRNNKPTLYFDVDNNRFYVYTGIEDFISIQDYNKHLDTLTTSSENYEFTWAIIKTKDSTNVIENIWPPYSKIPVKPTTKFKEPNNK